MLQYQFTDENINKTGIKQKDTEKKINKKFKFSAKRISKQGFKRETILLNR